MEKIKLTEADGFEPVIDFGSIRVRAFIQNGKETLIITATTNSDCILCMPTSSNQIVLQSGKSLL